MRVGRGPYGWTSFWSDIERVQAFVALLQVVQGRQLHEEVVGMLSVFDGLVVSRFALLEEQRVLFAGDGCRFKREHARRVS